ncbi:MAG TPA: hypothetical protein VGE35_02620 [Candidatus Paceibacterota bacterium]
MDSTVFLAQIWGPIMIAVGLGIFASRKYYVRLYRDLEKEMLAVLTFGIMAIALGIMHVNLHNIWGTFNQGLVSLFGWALAVKGFIFLIVPGFADRWGNWAAASPKWIPFVGVAALVIGGYLSWFAFLA